MKKIFFLIIVLACSSCIEKAELCTMDGLPDLDMKNKETEHYRFLDLTLVNNLNHAVTYKYDDESRVSFATSTNYNLMTFNLFVKNDQDLSQVIFKSGESKIQLGKCYSICASSGMRLKYRIGKTNLNSKPVIRVMSSKINKKVIGSNYVYFEGIIENMGLYLPGKECIVFPHENLYVPKPLHMKILLLKDKQEWIVHVFYSKKFIKTNILKEVDFTKLNQSDTTSAAENL